MAESCGTLAPYLPVSQVAGDCVIDAKIWLMCQTEIRSSLVLSILQQMLDDKSDEVRTAVIRSLGLIVSFIDDQDKYSQVAYSKLFPYH